MCFNPLESGVGVTAYASLDGFDENTPSKPGHLYRVTCTDSTCATHTWLNVSGAAGTPDSLPNIPTYAVAVNPYNSSQVFVGTEIGFYFTDNINAVAVVWQRFQSGLPISPVYKLTVDAGNTTLLAWTSGRGAYAVRLPAPNWQQANYPGVYDGELLGVAVGSANDVWAVGGVQDSSCNCGRTLTMHWNGSVWQRVSSPNNASYLNNHLTSVTVLPSGEAWAVGVSDTSGDSRLGIMMWYSGLVAAGPATPSAPTTAR